MKLILLTVFGLCIFASSYAQTSDEEAQAMANLLGVQKKEAMAKLVAVSAKDSAAFWKIYDEYAKKNIATGKGRIKLYEQTVHAYGNMTSATADSLAMKYFANRQSQEKTLEEYYMKIKKATNANVAFQFYQAELYLLTQIRASIMQQIPTYGQVQLATKKQ
ncbi:hypothetical protein [Pinibacter soli]|uniref:Uncharacterized protein n=1 Tax=Pinibacter soli TaxID=3044211 RepID=A0ABT6RHZ8_9BACT|nr:hypothetical protein [Pinibacter soli]MDI3322153.1 hypothetical protein [Pinibacter soli]